MRFAILRHRWTTLAAAVAGVMLAAAALAALPDDAAIVVGRRGDAPFVRGFGQPVVHRGLPGRWTRGLGEVTLPASPLPARLTIQVQPGDARAGEAVELFVDGRRTLQTELHPGRQTLAVDVPGCALLRGCRAPRVALQSTPWRDVARGETRGVFVGRVGVERGGRVTASAVAWLAAVALAAGLVVAAFAFAPSAPVAFAIAAWGVAALLLFRVALSPHWLRLAAAAWLAYALSAAFGAWRARTIGSGIGSGIARSVGSGTGSRIAFGVWAAGLVGLLFVEAFTRGWVLGQPQMLDPYYPWRAALPAAWEPSPSEPLGDVPMLVYPFLVALRERLPAGDIPLWTASLNGGQPFLGAYQTGVFAALNWSALIVPLPQATVVVAMLRLLVGGAGMFVFLRGLGLSRPACFVGGTAFLLNPFTVAWLEHPPGGVPPWLPWMLHAGTRAAAGARFGAPGLAVATAFVFLAGHPHTAVFCVLFGSAWAGAAALAAPRPWRRLAVVTAALALGVALASLQIAPFVEYLLESRGYAARQYGDLNRSFAPWSVAIAALVPRFLGEHAADTYAGRMNELEQTMYAGIPVLVLAAVGVATTRRDWRPPFFAGVGALATLAVYGTPGVLHAISALPLLRNASLTRVPIVAIACAGILAAFGAEALAARAADAGRVGRARFAALGGAAAIVIAIVVALTAGRSFLLRTLLSTETWRWSLWALLLATGAAAIVAVTVQDRVTRAWSAVALTALVGLDLFVHASGQHRLQPAERVYPEVPDLAALRNDTTPFRIVGAKGALMPNSAMVYGLQDVRAYDGLGIAAYAELLDVALAWAPAHQQHELHDAGSPVLDLLNVRYLMAPPDFPVDPAHWSRVAGTTSPLYRNTRERPRAFLVDGYVVETGNAARRRLRDGRLDAARHALLEREPSPGERPEPAATADTVGTARVASYAHERVVIETDAPGRRLLVLSDTWFPGWIATVDGREVAIARANYAVRAVSVPAGPHRVEFVYAPSSFRVGLAISALALVGIALWAFTDWRRAARVGAVPVSSTSASR